ncbi:MAG: hypothetical protein K6E75_00125 [Lachnospiraceae bacterium]|nr:hypothetical protein [Lachnospiraceae bacterium]
MRKGICLTISPSCEAGLPKVPQKAYAVADAQQRSCDFADRVAGCEY